MSKSVYEVDSDGASVIIWEAGTGHRIFFPDSNAASIAYEWLVLKSNQFHRNKLNPDINVYVAEAYGEPMTPFELVRRFIQVSKKYGRVVEENSLTRESKEYW